MRAFLKTAVLVVLLGMISSSSTFASSSPQYLVGDSMMPTSSYLFKGGALPLGDGIIQAITRGSGTNRLFYQNQNNNYYISPESPSFGSQTSFGYAQDIAYSSADLDQDNEEDLVISQQQGTSGKNRIVIVYSSGRVFETPLQTSHGDCALIPDAAELSNHPVLGDVDQDGFTDILVSFDCGVNIYDELGRLKGGKKFSFNSPGISSASTGITKDPILGDFNNDGKTDFLVQAVYKDESLGRFRYFIAAYKGDLSLIWSKEIEDASISIDPFVYPKISRPLVTDIDNNSELEILYSINNRTGVLSLGGTSKQEFELCGEYLVASDVNGDGAKDVITACNSNANSHPLRLNAVSSQNGQNLAGFPVELSSIAIWGQFITLNLEKGQLSNDILLPTDHGVIAVDGLTGSTLWSLNEDATCREAVAFANIEEEILLFLGCSIFYPGNYWVKSELYKLTDNGDPIILNDLNDSTFSMPGYSPSRDNSQFPVKLRDPDGGYSLVASDGGIFPFGEAKGYGSTGNVNLTKPMVGMESTADGQGYWLVAADGGIFPFGNAGGYGSTGNVNLWKPIVGMSRTNSGNGYWLVASDGGIFPFGDAVGYGSTGNVNLWKPIVGMERTKSGNGYWLVASDGGIFPFGDAVGYGSTGGINLRKPIVGMSRTESGNGYWIVASDGGIFPFGDAVGYGSAGNLQLVKPVVGMSRFPTGGYTMAASDGGTFSYGATNYGSFGGLPLWKPIVGMAAVGGD